jgi:PPOX class probable F420-dependent enzyme
MAAPDKLDAFLAEPRNLIVIGIRRDGTPHATPNWFLWDGERFYVSTTRTRVKFAVFRRDPRAQLVLDDSTAFRCVVTGGRVEVREDLRRELPLFRAIREKHGVPVPSGDEFLDSLEKQRRVLLAITPDAPPASWAAWGLD